MNWQGSLSPYLRPTFLLLKKRRIACLPVAGKDNPYQLLMMQGLNQSGQLEAISGVHDKFFGIIRTGLRFRPDYIHFDWESSYYYRKSLLLTLLSIPVFLAQILFCRWFMNISLVWTPHNLRPHDLGNAGLHRLVRRIFASQMDWIRLFSHRSLTAAAEEFKQAETRFRIVPEGSYKAYYPEYAIGKTAATLREELGIPPNHKVLLYLGLIKPYKGLTELLTAFHRLDPRDTTLLIAGKSMQEAYFRELSDAASAGRNVCIREGFVQEAELPAWYQLASAVVLPFRKIENSGSVIMAMGYKKAILAPAMGVLPDRLCRQPQLLYHEGPEEALSVFATLSQEELAEIGEANFAELEKYKWEDYASCFIR